jgi:hypothetical protein
MHQEPPAAGREPVPTCEGALAHAKPQGAAVVGAARPRDQKVKRSPLPSVHEIDAAIERKYGPQPYRDETPPLT